MNNPNGSIFVPDGKNAIHDGIEHDPGGGKTLLDPTDTLFLMLDHQSGLFQNVKDISVTELRANTTALAKLATLQRIPVITTASVPEGPNGPLMPEIHEAAPHAVTCRAKGRSMPGTTRRSSRRCAKQVRKHWSWPACGPTSASCFRRWMRKQPASKFTL